VVFLLQKFAIIRIDYRLVFSKRYVFLGLGWSQLPILSFVDLNFVILRSSFVLRMKWFNFLPWFVCTVGFWFCMMSLPWFRETKLCQGPAWPQCIPQAVIAGGDFVSSGFPKFQWPRNRNLNPRYLPCVRPI
jgi:hypothetical protein